MSKNRLEAFSDGVIAIIITLMVLEMKIPHGGAWSDLLPLWPVFLSYILSYIYIGIYWNNHHHLLKVVERINGPVLWANLHLMFWLSLIPFATGWMGENHFATAPVALYGVVLLGAAVAYLVLTRSLLTIHEPGSVLAQALGAGPKEMTSLALYVIGVGSAFIHPWIACAVYVGVAVMWLIPDRRIEARLADHSDPVE